ncbi:uncharacterized protein B0I36DRAFT_161303 [Microdochium trichocladiopsis]|uniref:Ankyrin repeat-containing domain protein n=1 Tax=Microdochium trichocladiopsis TaxID=1682393 RepID=A0A9P8Y0X8_9PEZI|nr:uncharacterized protein B0I36DRAFT_161303 [Microdochium trichocladiopsis]KAH7026688.1 hypothetical protein B0I36DRAFT_161303 [Microdochium trichocladiopsis]
MELELEAANVPLPTTENAPPKRGEERVDDIQDDENHLQRFAYLIQTSGFRQNRIAPTGPGWSPLTRAAAMGDVEAAERLISDGAQVNKADNYGFSPLVWAQWLARGDMIHLLLESGARRKFQERTASRYSFALAQLWTLPKIAKIRTDGADAIPPSHLRLFDRLVSAIITTRPWYT